MTAYELKRGYERNNLDGHFFSRRTMRFFGDTMHNFGVRDGGEHIFPEGEGFRKVPLLVLYRRHPVHCGLHGDVGYFRSDNFQEVHCIELYPEVAGDKIKGGDKA